MRSSRALFSSFLLPLLPGAILLWGCGGEGRGPGEPLVEATRPAFPGDSAYRLLEAQLAFGPRIPGTPGHVLQREWMIRLLGGWADTLEVQDFTYLTSRDDSLLLTNLLARFRPEASHRILLLTHWDTRPRADQAPDAKDRERPVPGANDGASGTAVLLALARMLSRAPPPTGVDVLFVDGEDYGPGTEDMFLGTRYFVQNLPTEERPTYALLLDMVGDADPLFPVEAYSAEYAPRVVQRVWRVAGELGFGGYFPDRVGPRVQDDHLALNQVGIPTADLIDFEYGPENRYWHTPEDVAAHTSAGTLGMVGEVVAELVYRGG